MKTLILVRHARAEPLSPALSEDKFRPLDSVGRFETLRTARALRSLGLLSSGLILACSDAERAKTTAALLAEHVPRLASSVPPDPALYNASAGDLLKWLQNLRGSGIYGVIMVAHNPGVSDLVARLALCGLPPRPPVAAPLPVLPPLPLPTCAFAAFRLPCRRWRDASPEGAEMIGAFAP